VTTTPETPVYDAVFLGAGVMSATLATLLHQLEPDWRLAMVDRLPAPALESSNAWNNAGTGHSALCELNYTPQAADGTIQTATAVKVNEQFQVSRQFWAHLVKTGAIKDPSTFITRTPHMSFVRGEADVDYLRRRHEVLKDHPLFQGLEYSEDPAQIRAWAPLVMQGRGKEKVAATFHPAGTDVNFGSLTRQLVDALIQDGMETRFEHEVVKVRRRGGHWRITLRGLGRYKRTLDARFVFVGAGGGALRLLQSSRIKEIRGYGGFPVSGQFLKTTRPEVVAQHHAKVYGKAAVGAPPMSVPHLDARVVDGGKSLLFGPYAGFTPRFLKQGTLLDLFSTIRFGNLIPMISVGFKTMFDGLLAYLFRELIASKDKKFQSLQEYFPKAEIGDWELITAGQRVQVIKRGKGGGVLQFGTEIVAASDGTIAGLLGASPGASTAAPIMLSVLEQCFPDKIEAWKPTLQQMVPSYGTQLSADPKLAAKVLKDTASVLGIE